MDRSRHFEEFVCRLGVPFSSPRIAKRKVRAGERGRTTTASERAPCSSALSPVRTDASRRLVPGREGHPVSKGVCGVLMATKTMPARFGTREIRVSWDRGPVEEDEVRSER